MSSSAPAWSTVPMAFRTFAAAEGHGAEAEGGNEKAGIAEGFVLHAVSFYQRF